MSTLIYGVKPSGHQCQVSIERLADHFLESGECELGASVLKETTYVDDILSSQDSKRECVRVADNIRRILGKGSMCVKCFTFSREHPSENVSADGEHVGLAGYLCAPASDMIKLDIGPIRLRKAKRGWRPEPVVGDLKSALKTCFTKKILTGLVAGVFDPLGLVTPITAGLKLDLHELCARQLDWDDQVPTELLE